MNPKYMLDTNICTYHMKHQPPEVRERFVQCFVGDVVISAVTLAEREFGIAYAGTAAQESNRSAMESLLDDIKVAPLDAQAAQTYGPILQPPKIATEMLWITSSHLTQLL